MVRWVIFIGSLICGLAPLLAGNSERGAFLQSERPRCSNQAFYATGPLLYVLINMLSIHFCYSLLLPVLVFDLLAPRVHPSKVKKAGRRA